MHLVCCTFVLQIKKLCYICFLLHLVMERNLREPYSDCVTQDVWACFQIPLKMQLQLVEMVESLDKVC